MSDETKPALRRHFRRERQAFVADLPDGERSRLEQALAAQLLPALADAAVIASYAACGDEIDPRWLAAARPGLAFPRVTGAALAFHSAALPDLLPGFGSIPEPAATAPDVRPDVLLVPLVAVTLDGTRLGQGAGHYDRTLAALGTTGRITTIGLAWDVQIADALPQDPWDVALDWVATPTRLVDCRKAR